VEGDILLIVKIGYNNNYRLIFLFLGGTAVSLQSDFPLKTESPEAPKPTDLEEDFFAEEEDRPMRDNCPCYNFFKTKQHSCENVVEHI